MALVAKTVCVTGAGGFIGSWLIKKLQEKGYTVRAAVRNPDLEGEGAKERLVLLKAELLDYKSLLNAVNGCQGVFHMACPLTDDPDQVIEPAIKGTTNIIDASAEVGVRRNWYCYAKTVAEKAARERAEQKNLELVVVNLSLVLGPMLQPTLNASTLHILKYLTGSAKSYRNMVQGYVHVEDVAEVHILVYEHSKAFGRYLCCESVLHRGDLVAILAELFPQYPDPNKCSDEVNPRVEALKISTDKLEGLGFSGFIPIRKSLQRLLQAWKKRVF